MTTSLIRISVITLAAAVAFTGCKKGPNGNNGLGDDDAFSMTTISDGDSGLALTGAPFDQVGTLIENTGIGPVYFGYDSSALPSSEYPKLQQAADYMNDNGNVVLIIEGHCDERGSDEYNVALGEQRALALRASLVELGISADRIQSRSFGEQKPAVLGTGEAVWAKNRRGEFAFYK